MDHSHTDTADAGWSGLYTIGAVAAMLAVLVSLVDIGMMFMPGKFADPGTLGATGWFTLLHESPLLGARNLGLFNIMTSALAVPLYLALYGAHRRIYQAYAALSVILLVMGATIYIANNRSLVMLPLSDRYAAATTASQRSLLAATGEVILDQGEDLTPGTFMGFFFSEAAGIVMGIVMLGGGIFSRLTAMIGITGSALLLGFNICAAFIPSTFGMTVYAGTIGGMCSVAWYVMIAIRLFRLTRTTYVKGGSATTEQLALNPRS